MEAPARALLERVPGFTYIFVWKKSRPDIKSCTVCAGLLILG